MIFLWLVKSWCLHTVFNRLHSDGDDHDDDDDNDVDDRRMIGSIARARWNRQQKFTRSRSNNLSVYVILPTLISKWKKEKRKLETLADIYHALSCKRYYESITLTFLMPFSQFDLLRCPPFHNVSAEKKAHTRNVDRDLIAVVCII